MELFRAIVLGAVQGLSEFLPISSSGHLILIREAFDWPDDGLAFDVGLHLGTLVALLCYFWRDWVRMIQSGCSSLLSRGWRFDQYEGDGKLLLLLALGTVPAGVVGLLLDDWIEENLREAWLVAAMLISFGMVLWLADRSAKTDRGPGSLGARDAILIGVAQALALIPGVSRSGVTISAGLALGFERESAARIAFLLGTPAFVGAGVLKAADLGGESGVSESALAAGFASSLVVGFLAVHGLMVYLRRRSLRPFVAYRLVVGLTALGLIAAR